MSTITAEPAMFEQEQEQEERPYQTLNYLDGPAFRTWCESQGVRWTDLNSRDQRRFTDWQHEGSTLTYAVADRFAVMLGLHLSDLPDHLWRKGNRAGRNGGGAPPLKGRTKSRLQQAAIKAVMRGETAREIAVRLGVTDKTIRTWTEEARKTLSRLDGRRTAAFLEEQLNGVSPDHRIKYAICRWQAGRTPKRTLVAELLKEYFNLTLDDLPDECWTHE